MVVNNRSKEPEEIILLVHSMTHCGRKKEMNDPYGTNLRSYTHTHTLVYTILCIEMYVRESLCVCCHWQSMHKLAIPVFALSRPSVSACSLSDFFSRSRFYYI